MSQQPQTPAPGWGFAAAPMLIGLLIVGAFFPALSAEFVSFDDLDNLIQNQSFRGFGSEQLEWMWTANQMGHYHPLSWLSFAFDYTFLGGAATGLGEAAIGQGGLDPAPFHRTNILLHALTAVTFFFVARRLLELSAELPARARLLGATAAALAFGVHPLRVESVAWVTERRDVLSGLFFALSVLAYLRFAPRARAYAEGPGRSLLTVALSAGAVAAFFLSVDLSNRNVLSWNTLGAGGFVLAIALFAAAVVSAARIANAEGSARAVHFALAALLLLLSLTAKAWGIVMPALLLVLDIWPLARTAGHKRPALPGRLLHLLAEKAPLFALTIVFASLAAWAQSHAGRAMLTLGDHGPLERGIQGLYGLAWYPWRTLVPANLAPIYALPEVLSLTQPRFAIPAACVLATTVVLFALRRRAPAGLAAWVAFGVIVSPVLGVAQSGPQLVADRYSYLSCMPFALLFGWGVAALCRSGRAVHSAALATALVGLVTAVLIPLTYARTQDWHDTTSLWEAAYAVQPEDTLTLLSLGSAREEAARGVLDPAERMRLLAEAEDYLQRGFEREPNPRFLANLGHVHSQLAQLEPERAAEHRAEAVEFSQRALKVAQAQDLVPGVYFMNLGTALVQAGRPDEALEPFRSYLERKPSDPLGESNYGFALGMAGRHAEAVKHFERSAELDPNNADTWGRLGLARRQSGDRDGAEAAFLRVLELVPGHPAATQHLKSLRRRGLDGPGRGE